MTKNPTVPGAPRVGSLGRRTRNPEALLLRQRHGTEPLQILHPRSLGPKRQGHLESDAIPGTTRGPFHRVDSVTILSNLPTPAEGPGVSRIHCHSRVRVGPTGQGGSPTGTSPTTTVVRPTGVSGRSPKRTGNVFLVTLKGSTLEHRVSSGRILTSSVSSSRLVSGGRDPVLRGKREQGGGRSGGGGWGRPVSREPYLSLLGGDRSRLRRSWCESPRIETRLGTLGVRRDGSGKRLSSCFRTLKEGTLPVQLPTEVPESFVPTTLVRKEGFLLNSRGPSRKGPTPSLP